MECSAQNESLSTSPPILDNAYYFIEATRSLLDEGDVTALDTLASRLSPFRIQYRSVVEGDIISVKPVLVLEHEQSPIKGRWKSTESTGFDVGVFQDNCSTLVSALNSGTTNTDPYKPGLTTPAMTNNILVDYEANSHENAIVYAQIPRYGTGLGLGTRNSLATTNVDLSQAHNAGLGLADTGHAVHETTDSSSKDSSGDCTLPLPDFDLIDFDGCAYLTGGGMGTSCHNQPTEMTHIMQNTRSLSSAGPPGDSIFVEFDSSLQTSGTVGNVEPRAPRAENNDALSTSGDTPISDFDSPEGCLVGDTHSPVSNTLYDSVKGTPSASDAALLKVNYALRVCIRADYVEFLETNLPRWVKHGIWRTVWPPSKAKGAHGYESLQKAYWNICRLDRQMGDDAIRSRMAMVMLHLEYEKACLTWKSRTSTKWASANSQRKSEMRAKFHDRKRKNTAVTAKIIKDIERAIKNSRTGLLDILNKVNPIAQSLFLNHGYESHNLQIKLPLLLEQPDSS
ncbi:Aurovertin biosynthesis cluster transcription factor aurF [Metarhizium brunneum]|uniref:Aurovertin biosynthesis cluster transcription factor aurF n=1 Tax=Metarhizium brunneum TaxID=500148 RepID=A0A7D5Z183_9HYPO|nr:Aurovertin biosynthesis cluster transcription factor aurF [Metarhizium brunneum]